MKNVTEPPLTLRDYLSYSQVNTYSQCSLKYGYRYVEGVEENTVSSSLVVGSAVHKALEVFHRTFMANTPRPKAEELVRPINDVFEDMSEKEIVYKKGETRASAEEQALALVAAYIADCPIEGEIIGVETHLDANLADWLQPLTAIVDVMERVDDVLRIIDIKTSASAWGSAKIEESKLQLALYRVAASPVAESMGCTLAQRFVVLVKTKTPRIQVLDVEIDDHIIERAKHLITAIWDGIEHRVFYPSPGWYCNGCSFKSRCQKWPG